MAYLENMSMSTKRRIMAGAGMAVFLGAVALAIGFSPQPSNGAGGVSEKSGKIPAVATRWTAAWPKTDFSRYSINLNEIRSGGPPKDGIPPIDDPKFVPISEVTDVKGTEPVISIRIGKDAKAYPLSVLMWHEIVNDTVGGVPVAVTFCPLCNAAVVFDRRLDGRVLDFGTTGKLRRSDLVMYDRQTESWWQQFLGEGIVGELTGKRLKFLPSRVESIARFKKRFPKGLYLVPTDPSFRRYGSNPYAGYDGLARPFLYDGSMPGNIAPLARVVSINGQAWSLELVRRKKRIDHGAYVITWEAGQNSALDSPIIDRGRDVGNVVVRKRTAGGLVDAVYGIDFAFAFHAFYPTGVIHVK